MGDIVIFVGFEKVMNPAIVRRAQRGGDQKTTLHVFRGSGERHIAIPYQHPEDGDLLENTWHWPEESPAI